MMSGLWIGDNNLRCWDWVKGLPPVDVIGLPPGGVIGHYAVALVWNGDKLLTPDR